MQPIPDTGPGVSGFLAYLLWHVYRHFPFPGTWDWLLLIIALAALTRILFLPYLWRVARVDVARARMGATRMLRGWAWQLLWDLNWLAILVWFFATPAGATFWAGRELVRQDGIEMHVQLALWQTSLFVIMALAPLVIVPDFASAAGRVFRAFFLFSMAEIIVLLLVVAPALAFFPVGVITVFAFNTTAVLNVVIYGIYMRILDKLASG